MLRIALGSICAFPIQEVDEGDVMMTTADVAD
jgi:hypothetical protein